MDNRYFSDKLVEWYRRSKRDLPWRDTSDPYRIWLSEIILQQTRVAQGLPYYERFVDAFPTVQALAAADEQQVLRLWQGLGYYTRARNLHKCAREVATRYRGIFPTTFEALKSLPGIGDYTAAAIASFAFREAVAVVDGNVFRVLSRVFGIDKAINSPEGRHHFTTIANQLLSKRRPDLHNQAVMEFGALHCLPANPACNTCMFETTCIAAQQQLQTILPVKIKGKAARTRHFHYFVVQHGKSLLMKRREARDIWQGLFDFYLIESKTPKKAAALIQADPWLSKLKVQHIVTTAPFKHVLTHQVIRATFTVLTLKDKRVPSTPSALHFYDARQIAALPKPVLISRFLDESAFF